MTREQYIALAQHYEQEARQSPRAYKRKMMLFTAFAYSVLIGSVVAVLALLIGFAALIVGTVAMGKGYGVVLTAVGIAVPLLVVTAWLALRVLSIPVPPPEGVAIELRDHPALLREVERIAKQLNTPMPHVVLLDSAFNASVIEVPRWGLFGGHRRYLTLGMPLLDCLSHSEAVTVIGHELAHLSRLHSASKVWILRARETWLRAVLAIERAGADAGIVWDVFVWFEHRLSARTLALSRQHEFEADRLAGSIFSNKLVAESLVRIMVTCPVWEKECDRQINRAIKAEPEPPADLFERVFACRPAANMDAKLREKLVEEFQAHATVFDTHPSLTMSLASLGASINPDHYVEPMLRASESSASAVFFGDRAAGLRREVGKHWTRNIVEHWHEAHEEARDHAAEVATILQKPENYRIPREHWVLLVDYLEEDDGPEKCEPQLRWLVARAPYLEEPLLELMALLARRGSPECLDLAARLTDRNSVGGINFSARVILAYLRRAQRDSEIEGWRSWFSGILRGANEWLDEAFQIDPLNPWFKPHNLTRPQAKRLARQLHKMKVFRAWVVEKIFASEDEPPLFVIIVERETRFEWNEESNRTEWFEEICEKLVFPHRYLIIDGTRENKMLADAASRIARSRILPR